MAFDPWEDLLEEVGKLGREGEAALGYPPLDVAFEIPPPEFGDLALPVHGYARAAKRSPVAIAQALAEAIPITGFYVDRCEARAGYVNFFLHLPTFGERTLKAVLMRGPDYGRGRPTGRRVLVEHTSINPTGPVHVGRARNAIIGDTLARLLDRAGHAVTREFLVNDAGKQVLTLVWGVDHLDEADLDPAERDKEDHRLVRYYQRATELAETDPTVPEAIDAMSRRLEAGDAELLARVRAVSERMMEGIVASLARLGIAFDTFFWEDRTVQDGSAREVVTRLAHAGVCQEEDGALYVDMGAYGIAGRDTRWFVTKKDGTTLYTTRDLAYHLDKFQRSDEAVNVLGEDHKLEFRQLSTALRLLGVEREVEAVFYAHVALPEGRLSTRKGRVVHMDDLMDEAHERALEEVRKRRDDLSPPEMEAIAEAVGIGAIRYNIAKVQAEKRILFRWEEALSLEGQTAPFLQYSYARACGILRKAEEGWEGWDPRLLKHPQERALVKLLARYPATVREAAQGRRPHPMATFAHELATTFNLFYRDCPVLQSAAEVRQVRLALVEAFRTVLGDALETLGIRALEAM